MQRVVLIPKRHEYICIDCRSHCVAYSPRKSRNHFWIAFRPLPIPGFPIPAYFANGLSFRTAVTRTPSPSSSNCSRSPARTPSLRRTSRGIVTCPLLVTFACFFNVALIIPYCTTLLLTFETIRTLRTHNQQST